MGDKVTVQLFKDLLTRLHTDVLKPRGFKKDGSNFRFYRPDGLCWIINFQRSMFCAWFECGFTMNVGVYYEPDVPVKNVKFREQQCWIRTRAAAISPRYEGMDHWWEINELQKTDMDALYEELKCYLECDVLPWLEKFDSKEETEQKYGYKHRYGIDYLE